MTLAFVESERDDGSVSLLVAVVAVALLAVAGLVVDGGARVRAARDAERVAAEAGRAALQQVDVDQLNGSGRVGVDLRAARSAALQFVAEQGLTGTARIERGGQSITVVVTEHPPSLFLGLIGIQDLTIRGSATTVLVPAAPGQSP